MWDIYTSHREGKCIRNCWWRGLWPADPGEAQKVAEGSQNTLGNRRTWAPGGVVPRRGRAWTPREMIADTAAYTIFFFNGVMTVFYFLLLNFYLFNFCIPREHNFCYCTKHISWIYRCSLFWLHMCSIKLLFLFLHISPLFQILFPFMLLQNIEWSSLCYTVGPFWLSILFLNFLIYL